MMLTQNPESALNFTFEPLETRALLSAAVEAAPAPASDVTAITGASVRESMFGRHAAPSRRAAAEGYFGTAFALGFRVEAIRFQHAIDIQESLGFFHQFGPRIGRAMTTIIVVLPDSAAPVPPGEGAVISRGDAAPAVQGDVLETPQTSRHAGDDILHGSDAPTVASEVLGLAEASAGSSSSAGAVINSADTAVQTPVIREATGTLERATRVAVALGTIDPAVFAEGLIESAAVSAAAALSSASAGAAAEIAATVVPAATFFIPRLGSSVSLMCDSIATMTDEFASIPPIFSMAETQNDPRRAWFVTGTVVAADVLLLTYLLRRRAARQNGASTSA